MKEETEKIRQGRRALFAGTGTPVLQEESIPVTEIREVIQKISIIEDSVPEEIPPIFEPVTTRLITLVKTLHQQKTEFADLESSLLLKNDQISSLTNENIQLSSERESYLNDLITSHTEFDRALEIFQYHDVPMVLTGPDRSLYDANNSFCTLFSIARSNITTAHPSLSKYFPDEPTIIGPDGERYSIVTLTPPVVPFDHEAISLVILIKTSPVSEPALQESEVPEEKNLTPDFEPFDTNEPAGQEFSQSKMPNPAALAFDFFPIPAVAINQYRTITACNQAFGSLVGRTKEQIILRDIGSCGIRLEDADAIGSVLQNPEPSQIDGVINHPDGTESRVYLEITPFLVADGEPQVLVVGVPVTPEYEPEEIKTHEEGKPSIDIMLRMLLDLNPAAAALLDKHAKILAANEGFAELTGTSPSDLFGTDVRDLGVLIPDAVLVQDATEVMYLPEVIRMETAWGVQESSGMVAPVGTSGSSVAVILILQPIIPPAEKAGPAPITQPSVQVEPETCVREVAETEKEQTKVTLDLNLVPVPGLQSDHTGLIVKVNESFSRITGVGPEQIEGHRRQELLVSDQSGLIHVSLSSGDFWLQEYPQNICDDKPLQTYWYMDLTDSTKKIRSLEKQIQTVQNEIKGIREKQGTQSKSQLADANEQIDIVEFELNEERYAIDITMVREVVEFQPVTPLPKTPPYVIGIINLRGEVTHVIDLAILLGQRPKKDRSGQKIIIIPSDVTNGEHVGIIVDNVQSVTEIMGRHVSMLGDDITTQIKTHIKGIIKISYDDILEKRSETSHKTTLIIWLDIKKILHDIQGYS
ncbi:MAG: chemotaxis protein CheW [Methanospirillum sp.]|uniref:chemotaxis protein CheW n=1 Tax=Methanospirillum sp. TaxID=45200 RepID=UPI002371F9A3|nr:chemotaxis protein CheW [Methanospirillum sp.]MDD1728291.1 chemotaxis protein CheW [Methanospirillum sp.]